jgi:hypothetical protein
MGHVLLKSEHTVPPWDRTLNDTIHLTTVDVNQTFPALDFHIACPDLNATVKADLYTKLHVDMSVTIEAAGWIFLVPGLSKFEITFGVAQVETIFDR